MKMLAMHGHRFVCMDTTHQTNAYGFLLTTLMVVDDRGAGFAVAWLFSQYEDAETIKKFVGALMEQCVTLELSFPVPSFFMSDKANALVNGWRLATGQSVTPTFVFLARSKGVAFKTTSYQELC